jgi:regulator of sirC expression with transglutaminase-like and TPR domain
VNLSLIVPTPLEYFASLVKSDAGFPMLEAAICLAQDEHPELDVQQVLGEVDHLLARVKLHIAADATAIEKLRTLNQFFYRDLSFACNVNHYYDPGNSYVNVVLQTRRGIPISLAVVWLELAQGLGLAARGVGFPGHFMLKVNLPNGQVVIDPLDGQSLSREELAERLEPFKPVNNLIEEIEIPLGIYLQVAPPRDIIARMLRNLKEIHASQEDWQRLISVQNRLIVLLPHAWAEFRDRGLAHAEMGQTEQALADLETFIANSDDGTDVNAISARVAQLKQAKH